MQKNIDLIIGFFIVWCLAATYWYTIVHNRLSFANQSEIIDNHILEILIIISASFLFGYLFHKSVSSPNNSVSQISKNIEEKLEIKKVEIKQEIKTETVKSIKDDLKIVEGIGPAIEKLLNKEGIQTYWQLAETTEEKLLAILTKAGPLYLNHGESTWGEQATLLRDGKMEEFQKLASTLVGGNRVN